jgi:vacuolar-type H+-ATPase subunit F/Vma7
VNSLLFIGDELSAAGYRLAGARVLSPEPAALAAAFAGARNEAALVLISAQYAALLPRALLDEALLAQTPLTVVVPDVRGQVPPPDLERRLRASLGVEE